MSLQRNILPYHTPVIPTNSGSSTTTSSNQDNNNNNNNSSSDEERSFLKLSFLSWRVLGGIFATMLVVGWVFIIVILIQEEKWQLVLVAWLLLYAAAHFCYWYFKRHHLLSLHSQLCGRVRGPLGSVEPLEKTMDSPPSYDDILKSEPPPPTYYSVVEETPKASRKSSVGTRFPFSLQGLPRVFGGRNSASSSPSNERATTSTTGSAITSSSSGDLKRLEEGKCYASSPYNTIPTISGSIDATSTSCKSFQRSEPPPYSAYADVESQVIIPTSHSSTPSPSTSRRSTEVTEESVENINSVCCPVHKHSISENSFKIDNNQTDNTAKIHQSSSTEAFKKSQNSKSDSCLVIETERKYSSSSLTST